MTTEVEFDAYRLLSELTDGGVRYVVLGGVAARALGSPLITADLDVCHARDDANREALAATLQRVHARLRNGEPGLPFPLDAKTIASGDPFAFQTDFGALDIIGTPSGTSGFEDLLRTAVRTDLDGSSVLVAGIDDLIRMKRAAGRPQDLRVVEELGALREELDAQRP